MQTVAYIEKIGDIHYYYSFVNNSLTVNEFIGGESALERKLDELTAQSFLALYEDFLHIDKETIDKGKEVHSYEELRKRVKAYIEWGHKNISSSPGSVAQNGYIARKYITKMIDMISHENINKKKLVMISHSIKETFERLPKFE